MKKSERVEVGEESLIVFSESGGVMKCFVWFCLPL